MDNETPFTAGRKIYYLFPQGNFHQSVVQHIIDREYEVYTLSDHVRGLPLIFQNTGAIVFINLDGVTEQEKFMNGVQNFCRQSSNRSIELFLICSSSEQYATAEKMMCSHAHCSCIDHSGDVEAFSRRINTILTELHARGNRSYVRFGSNTQEIAELDFQRKGKKIKGIMHDISSAGLSFSVPEDTSLPLRSKLEEVSVDMGYTIDDLYGVISLKRKLPNGRTLYVLLFNKNMPSETKQHLRFVIHASLQRQFLKRLNEVAVP